MEVNTIDDKMTALISLQSSNGMFAIPTDRALWEDSAFNKYLGSLEKVKMGCPGIALHLWITALAMQIMKLKMPEKKNLWELVAEKSKKYLLTELMSNEEEYKKLQESAGKYIMKA